MKSIVLAAGVAALAISTPALAQPEGKGKPEKSERGNGNGGQKARGNGNGNGRGNGNAGQDVRKAVKAQRQDARQEMRARGQEKRERVQNNARERRQDVREVYRDRRGGGNDRIVERVVNRDIPIYRYGDRYDSNYRSDCPPGLAKKNNGCLPPGQAQKLTGQRFETRYADRELFGAYRDWYGRDDDYRYRIGDDFLYRIGAGDLIDGLIPLYDRRGYYYPVGSRYPQAYDSYNLPYQYRSYYDDPYYRYGDGAIYRIDPQTQLIQSVVSLLTGDVAVGQPLPSTYSVYNVPSRYRSQYYDSPDNYYRYSDGYIYRADPTTMLVTEIIKAIV